MNPAKCRDLRHSWDHVSDEIITRNRRRQVISFKRILVCARCGTFRQDAFKVISTKLVRNKTTYIYPDGYHMPKGVKLEDIRYQLFKSGEM